MSEQFEATADMWALVRSHAHDTSTILVCCTELIDNSLDWEATHIEMDVGQNKFFQVRDNGLGIKDWKSLVKWGGHVENVRKKGSGIWGVGLKDSTLYLGGETGTVSVDSVRESKRRVGVIEWVLLKKGPKCLDVGDPVVTDDPSGTTIRITPLRRRFPDGQKRQELIEDLAYVYWPALKSGKTIITIRAGGTTTSLSDFRWKLPEMTDVVDRRIEIGNKSAHVHAGIVKDGVLNNRPGLTYTHHYRVVKASSREGCGTHAINKICGIVELEKGWVRTRNKTDLDDAQDLYEAIENTLRNILEKADVAASHMQVDPTIATLECAFSEILGQMEEKKKAKRQPKVNRINRPDPETKGSKHQNAKDTQTGDGDIRPPKASKCLRIEYGPGWKGEGDPHGEYEVTSKTQVITLYEDHPLVAQARATDPMALFLMIASLLSHGPTKGQTEMFTSDKVRANFAFITSKSHIIDGRSVGVDKAAE